MLLSILSSLLVAFLLFLGVAASVFSFPFNYIIWGAYNRKNINIWLIVLLILLSLTIALLYLTLFWKDLTLRSLLKILLGVSALITIPFLITRIVTYETAAVKKRYYLAVGFTAIQAVMLLSPVLGIHYYLYTQSLLGNFFVKLISLEATILMWISLVTFLFIKYPEDVVGSLVRKKCEPYLLSLRTGGRANRE